MQGTSEFIRWQVVSQGNKRKGLTRLQLITSNLRSNRTILLQNFSNQTSVVGQYPCSLCRGVEKMQTKGDLQQCFCPFPGNDLKVWSHQSLDQPNLAKRMHAQCPREDSEPAFTFEDLTVAKLAPSAPFIFCKQSRRHDRGAKVSPICNPWSLAFQTISRIGCVAGEYGVNPTDVHKIDNHYCFVTSPVEPRFTYTSVYVLLLYVLFVFWCITLNTYLNLIDVLRIMNSNLIYVLWVC